MAITQNIYTGNGSNRLFSFSFPYLDESDILIEVNDVLTTAYTFANATTIEFTTAPANGARVRIYRVTDTDSPESVFFPGSSIRASDLNDAFTQTLFSVQEWRGQTVPLYNAVLPDDLDLGGNQINNLEDPSLPQDAATKNYVDTTTWNNTTETIQAAEAWVSSDDFIATTGSTDNRIDSKIQTAIDDTEITTAEQDAGSPAWEGNDSRFPTAGAAAKRFDTLVQTGTPSGSDWQVGKTWLQNDTNKTLSIWNGLTWLGVASGGTFTTQPTVIYVDAVNGDDASDGHRIINPKRTIKNAVASAAAGDIIKVAPGVYQEVLPIDITVANLSIVGEAQRSCFIHPTPATETQIMFRCNSGTYIDNFTFVGLKASGTRGGNPVDSDPTYGLPTNQGWVAGFYPGCVIRKSPYINNATNFADSGIDNSSFDPNNYQGTGGDVSSAPTGGGIIVDGSVPALSSPLRSFVVNEFTQVCLDGPGLLVCNNGYAQAVSFFGLFCHYHAKALSGGQINMEVGTTDFGRYGLIADGKSTAPIFTATANGAASAGAITFAVNAPTAGGSWFGDANRPAINMLVQIGANIYPILSSSPNGTGWNVTISRPNPSNRSENLGLISSHTNGAAVSFFLRSMISTASHTMEYAGSGTDYLALPENGGVPNETNEVVNRNDGKVWLTSTDQSGKFKVGDTFQVDQQTGFVSIDPAGIAANVVSDLTPELGGNLDVLNRNIYSSTGNVVLNDTVEIPSGSAASPSLRFIGDVNTGLFMPMADTVGFATNGSERARIDSSGRLLVGTSTARSNFDTTIAPQLQIESTSVTGARFSITRNADSVGAAEIFLGKTRSSVNGGSTAVLSGDSLGGIAFWGADGTNLILGASINGAVDGTPGANDMPGRLVFSTTADGAASPTERMRIDSAGRVLVGTSTTNTSGAKLQTSDGLTFPATQVASADPNTLDDYEEGLWTPSVGGNATYTTQSGSYTKIGNLVTATFNLKINVLGTGATDRIQGLPFTSGGQGLFCIVSYFAGLPSNIVDLVFNRGAGPTEAFAYALTAAGATTNPYACWQNGAEIRGSFVYRT